MEIIDNLSDYIDYESLNSHNRSRVLKHQNDKEAYRRSAKTAARSFRCKQQKQPPDSLPLLQPSGHLQDGVLYRGQLDASTNIDKNKYKRKKRSSKSTRTYERDLKLQPDEPTSGLDAVLITKPLLKIDVPTRFMCLNSELAPTSPSYRRKISFIMNECPEDRQEFFKVFSCLLRMGNSAKQEKEKQLANNYNRQPSTEEQIWQNQLNDVIWLSLQAWFAGRTLEEQDQYLCIQRQAIEGILEEIMQFHFRSRHSTLPSISENVPFKQFPTDSLSPEYIAQQKDAVKQVTALLEKLESVEQLYPTSKAMAKDFELYGSDNFIRRVKTMCVWLNSTKELSHIMKVMTKVLGIVDMESINWPYRDFESPDSSIDLMDEKESEDNEQAAVEGIREKLSKANMDLLVDKVDGGVLERRKDCRKSVRFCSSAPPSEDCTDSEDTDKETDLDLSISPPSTSTPLKIVNSNSSLTSLSRSSSDISLDDQSRTAIYRHFVDKSLKQRGLRKILHRLHDLLNGTLQRAKQALEKIPVNKKGRKCSTVDPPHLTEDLSNVKVDNNDDEIISQYGVWCEEFRLLGLPSFRSAYLFLLRIPLDIVHECIKLRLEQRPKSDPSFLSIRQLMYECKEVIKAAVEVKQLYQSMLQAVMWDELLEKDVPDPNLEQFDDDVKEILEVYLHYLQSWILMLQNLTQASRSQKNVLEEEWFYTKEICPHIRGGEALAGKIFCFMASGLLGSIADFLETGIDECTTHLYDSSTQESDFTFNMSSRQTMLQICRDFKELFHEARERALKALGFAKMLCKDLEIAADFNMTITCAELLQKLKETNHIRVIAPHSAGYLMFIPEYTAKNEQHILQLLNVTCGREDNSQTDMEGDEGYLLLVKCESGTDRANFCPAWTGPVKRVEPTAETTIALSHIQVDGLLLVVIHSSRLFTQRKTFQRVMDNVVELVNEHTSCHQAIAESLSELKVEATFLQVKIAKAIQQIDEKLNMDGMMDIEDCDKTNILKSYRETMHQCYNFGFEYYKEVTRLVTGDAKNKLGDGLIDFAKQWMKFVSEKCDRGRGLRPRWANQGLDFLITACDPKYLADLTEKQFLELKQSINECVSHVIGSAEKSPGLTISRATSPSILLSKQVLRNHSWPEATKLNRSTSSRSDPLSSPSPFEEWQKKRPSIDSQSETFTDISDCSSISIEVAQEPKLPIERTRNKIEKLEKWRQNKLSNSGVIGRVSQLKIDNVVHINARRVTFRWQRGIKVGEGRFGKVYTAVNMDTGEMMAIKEIRFQPNDHRAIKEIADEIKTFEGILHPNLVKYYGVEVHREEMLIFMEYCDEGTLQEAARLGLPESMVRKYTRELVVAINILHENSIVHRDIKGANIFLTSQGYLKLGDFGCSVKLKTHTTMPGEVNALVGTTAYMAPEVFTQNDRQGHGRAADIWSLGCVVAEMATGKHPWHELDNDYQIMFKVGMGGTPTIPDALSAEGKDFLNLCFDHDPKKRWTASQLQDHPFCKIYEEDQVEG